MTGKIRVALFDDHPLMREGVVNTLNSAKDFEVIAEGATRDDAVRVAQDALPDIVLLDISMPGGGIDAAQDISSVCPFVRIVMLTVSEDEADVSAALRAGAHGYILKGVGGPEFLRTLRAIHSGEDYVSPSLAARLLTDFKKDKSTEPKDSNLLSSLTFREEQILELVAQGLRNKEVGEKLDLSEKTVKHYMTIILQKLQVRNRVEAAMIVQRRSGQDTS